LNIIETAARDLGAQDRKAGSDAGLSVLAVIVHDATITGNPLFQVDRTSRSCLY